MNDKYANILYNAVEESSVNTLTFDSVDFGLSLFDKVGILIHRIEWHHTYAQLIAVGDTIKFGLSTSQSWTTVAPSEASIITYHLRMLRDYGTAGVNNIFEDPLIEDFSTIPGGGLLVTPQPLYQFVEGTSLPSAGIVRMRMFFTIVNLKAEEYFELLETRQYFG